MGYIVTDEGERMTLTGMHFSHVGQAQEIEPGDQIKLDGITRDVASVEIDGDHVVIRVEGDERVGRVPRTQEIRFGKLI